MKAFDYVAPTRLADASRHERARVCGEKGPKKIARLSGGGRKAMHRSRSRVPSVASEEAAAIGVLQSTAYDHWTYARLA
jgi:hypothetical protein